MSEAYNFESGKLYLIPNDLGGSAPLEVLPLSVKKKIEDINDYIVENEKTARRFIKKMVPGKSQPSLNFSIINKYTKPEDLPEFLTACLEGKDMGVISEAGCPGIADPGADIVKLAHSKNIKVVPLVGPSSIFLTMMSSGLNGQNFAFHGYLPIDKNERKSAIRAFEKHSLENNQAQIFIETPYRNEKFFADLLQYLHPQTTLCIGCEVTQSTEFILTRTVQEWKKIKIDLNKRPSIFIFQKEQ